MFHCSLLFPRDTKLIDDDFIYKLTKRNKKIPAQGASHASTVSATFSLSVCVECADENTTQLTAAAAAAGKMYSQVPVDVEMVKP